MVTICALKHGCYFEKQPKFRTIVENEIINIQRYFTNITIPHSVVMPNHIHAIISIKNKVEGITLGRIIGVFKGKTINKWLKIIKKEKINEIGCIWQRNYFEHRIRNEEEFEKCKKYIELNPMRWKQDKYNPDNLKCRGAARRRP